MGTNGGIVKSEEDRKAVQGYLDHAIMTWRRESDEAVDAGHEFMAKCYIYAYQSARASLLGEKLEVIRKGE